ncbi:outer membrane lipid asymmetry maintenance protein MlaD [Candidatus Erwinia haradaeae]|uniref:Intermembrane phospholipid transport system binding protein MlaD, partial n=1 Tax=Candidatus Erwinia haradaeae TaxID=1922217 RepID=A0A451D212_9GAMM|nr:outer membrane lipid asymmetry maintenance protein MlaD [Candidatus Erwinia haradaeae]VFP79662.1 Intermembrane phospholipid transport system binding protein MlaD [Candidatus Erwinia haradaeae]
MYNTNKKSEILVGAFLLLSIIAVLFLCLHISRPTSPFSAPTWKLYATFDNIGELKTGSPVKVGGVVIGRVKQIILNPNNYLLTVSMDIEKKYNNIPNTSSLAVRTSGLLGEQYLALNIGFTDSNMGTNILKDGSTIQDTKSVIILEDLIGQFLYKSEHTKNQNSLSLNKFAT